MQKFRSYLYCNDEMLQEIINQISKLNKIKKEEDTELSSNIIGGANIGVAKLDGDISTSTKTKYESRQSDIEEFINWCEDKENTLDLSTIKPQYKDKGVIAIANEKVYLPDQIQDIELIQSIIANAPLLSTMPGMNDDENKNITKILKDSERIPVLMDINNELLLSCQITKKYLKNSVNDFLECMDEDITMIVKIDNLYENGKIEIFDIAKEILKVSRTVRRRMTNEQLKDIIIYEDAPIIKVTPLIIYR